MAQPVKYLKVVSQLLAVYQRELLRLFKKYPLEQHQQFKKAFQGQYALMKETEVNKAISDGISPECEPMANYLDQPVRVNKTSIENRKNLRSQGGNRIFRMTAGFKRDHENQQPIQEQQQSSDLLPGYRLQDEIMPKMRMKWKSAYDPERKVQSRESSTIGNNNIDLLSYTIPEIQNSIRRLSLQRSPKSVKERQLQIYRTLQSRSMKKKFIPRLF